MDFTDEDVAVLDEALSDINQRLMPLLLRFTPEELVEEMSRMIDTHLTVELQIIADGPEGESWGELSEDNQQLGIDFQRMKREAAVAEIKAVEEAQNEE